MSGKSSLQFVTIWTVGMFLVSGGAAAAQTKETAVKQYEQLIYSVRGPDLYHAHCAACHGPEGKGNGPAAAALKTKPADLTILTKNNGGKFPTREFKNLSRATTLRCSLKALARCPSGARPFTR